MRLHFSMMGAGPAMKTRLLLQSDFWLMAGQFIIVVATGGAFRAVGYGGVNFGFRVWSARAIKRKR